MKPFKFITLLVLSLMQMNIIYSFLSEDDTPIKSLNAIEKKPGQNNQALKLIFQKKHGNFLIFYDFFGETLYLQFRRDKWDYSKDEIIHWLKHGETYLVTFELWGSLPFQPDQNETKILNKIQSKKNNNSNDRYIREEKQIFIGNFVQFESVVLQDLRY